ncbi:alpha/beta hydrolase [Nocardia sp. NPDC057440]|uniref:alpha/beta hydrolase n=1 Tax=Nocardia sp. NPDC057440 TaxID=3346134 RepID=UPI00367125C0
MLDAQQPGEPRIYLAHIDENRRVAFSLDDPDFADNTAVLLGPAGRDGDALEYASPTVAQLRELALLSAPGARTSVSYWDVYQQPQSFVETIFPQFAQDGAAGAREFHTGLRATHEGSPGHITTLGHSYASVLTGHSAGGGARLDTDDVVFIGSWGTGTNNASELSLGGVAPENTADHVFATMSSGDHVRLMPDTHGPLPTDPEYGARTFESMSLIPDRWNGYDHRSDFYLASTNPAAQNIGLVITGRGDLVS